MEVQNWVAQSEGQGRPDLKSFVALSLPVDHKVQEQEGAGLGAYVWQCHRQGLVCTAFGSDCSSVLQTLYIFGICRHGGVVYLHRPYTVHGIDANPYRFGTRLGQVIITENSPTVALRVG